MGTVMRFTRLETISYIATQTAELKKLAIMVDFGCLAQLLDMARLEANNHTILVQSVEGVVPLLKSEDAVSIVRQRLNKKKR